MSRPIQYPIGVTPEMVRELHAFYVGHTRRDYKLDARIEAGWIGLLDGHTVEDVRIVIRYLHRRVTRPDRALLTARNPGCLKLTADNLFNRLKFQDDLAEAKSILRSCGQRRPATTLTVQKIGDLQRTIEVPAGSADGSVIAEAVKAEAARFRNQMRSPGAQP